MTAIHCVIRRIEIYRIIRCDAFAVYFLCVVIVLDYGNVLNPVVDLLSKRYDEQLFTIATTNITPDEIRSKYGNRIADRFNETMERIVFTNGTYRV